MPVSSAAARSALAVGSVGALGLGYAALIERQLFTLRRAELPVLAPGSRPLRVLQFTDLHLTPGQRRKVEWVRDLAQLRPDLVVNTGDNIAHPGAVATALRAFEPFFDTPGVFVLGSNDYFSPAFKNPWFYLVDHKRNLGKSPRLPTDDLVRGFEAGGWRHLRNRRTRFPVRGVEVEFVGVDDPHLDYDRLDLVDGPPDPEAQLTMGVMHAPYQRVLDQFSADGAGLLLAGHTHGGQLCLPGWGALVTNCDLDTRRAKGVSRWWPGAAGAPSRKAPHDAAYLHVSAGLGTSPLAPVRFACRPEATLLTLTPRPPYAASAASAASAALPHPRGPRAWRARLARGGPPPATP